MELKIYNRKGALKLTVSPSDNSTRQKRLMSDHVLSLSFTAFECVPLEVYDYVDFEGVRFWSTATRTPPATIGAGGICSPMPSASLRDTAVTGC